MTITPQRQAAEVIRTKILLVDERYDGYTHGLASILDDIFQLEKDQPHNVAKQISQRVTILGKRLAERKENIE